MAPRRRYIPDQSLRRSERIAARAPYQAARQAQNLLHNRRPILSRTSVGRHGGNDPPANLPSRFGGYFNQPIPRGAPGIRLNAPQNIAIRNQLQAGWVQTIAQHRRPPALRSVGEQFDFNLHSQAINGLFRVYNIDYPSDDNGDPLDFLDFYRFLRYLQQPLIDHLTDLYRHGGMIRWSIAITVNYESDIFNNTSAFTFHSQSRGIIQGDADVQATVAAALEEIYNQHENLQQGASNWMYVGVANRGRLSLRYARFARGIRAGGRGVNRLLLSGGTYIPSPSWIRVLGKEVVLNIHNRDDQCFLLSMHAAFLDHQVRGGRYDMSEETDGWQGHCVEMSPFIWDELTFPIHPLDLDKFESLNRVSHHVYINVFYADEESHELSIVRHGGKYISVDSTDHWEVDLLILSEQDNDDQIVRTHWCYIRRLSSLILAGSRLFREPFICRRCLQHFTDHSEFTRHKQACYSKNAQAVYLPMEDDAYRYFKAYHKTRMKPFVIYLDTEAFNKKLPLDIDTDLRTQHITEHKLASYGMYLVSRDFPELNAYFSYTTKAISWDTYQATEIGTQMIQDLLTAKREIKQYLYDRYRCECDISVPQWKEFESEDHCCLCGLDFKRGMIRYWQSRCFDTAQTWHDSVVSYASVKQVLTECYRAYKPIPTSTKLLLYYRNRRKVPLWWKHIGKDNYRGAAHYACMLQSDGFGKIPVIVHNLSRYDGHFLIQALNDAVFEETRSSKDDRFQCIPDDGDKFVSFSFGGLEFIDSYRFEGASLDVLVEQLKKSGCEFKHLADHFDLTSLNLMKEKGVFPYDWFDDPVKLCHPCLPGREHFYNRMTQEHISESDYDHAKRVWDAGQCLTFQHYHDLYLRSDVILLAEVMESFRTLCLQEYKLEPLWYHSLPGLALDCALFTTKTTAPDRVFEIELFYRGQEDMYEFVEGAIRGGVSMTPGRYAEANNQFLSDGVNPFDRSLPTKHILHWDETNLYGWAMLQELPVGHYRWAEALPSISNINHGLLDGDISYISNLYEVDGFFPNRTHHDLQDFPPMPIHDIVKWEETSPYYRALCDQLHIVHDSKTAKLLCHLKPKYRYPIYGRNLAQCLQLGFVITNVHRILRFDTSTWLSDFIMSNTRKRAAARTDFEKGFYKLVNNAVYGKTIQNNRKFRNATIIHTRTYNTKSKWDPLITNFMIVNQDIVVAYLKKEHVQLNSPILVGAIVLEHAKWLMYDFWYNTAKAVFGNRIRLIMTDTDSFCVEIESINPVQELARHNKLDQFDMSGWSEEDDSYYDGIYHDKRNKGKPGTMKFEHFGKYIREIVALRSKMYSEQLDQEEKWLAAEPKLLDDLRIAKGIARVAKRRLKHEQYKAALLARDDENYTMERVDMYRISSDHQQLRLTMTNKLTLNPLDNKCYMLDAIRTLPYGHMDIPSS